MSMTDEYNKLAKNDAPPADNMTEPQAKLYRGPARTDQQRHRNDLHFTALRPLTHGERPDRPYRPSLGHSRNISPNVGTVNGIVC